MPFGRRSAQRFTSRRIPGPLVIVAIVLAAFAVGMGAGWGSPVFVGFVAKVWPQPDVSATPSVHPSVVETPDIPVDLYPKLDRFMNDDDRAAGLTSLDVPTLGDGNFVVIPGTVQPPTDAPVRWVRLEIEDGVPLDPDVLSTYVMSILNDPQGWGAHGRVSFGRTDGAADIRIVFATPKQAEGLCKRPHEPATISVEPPDVPPGPVGIAASAIATPTPGPTASPSPSVSATPEYVPSCAEQGLVVVSAYQWAAGIPTFGDDGTSEHAYMINHFIGHILGEEDATCTKKDEVASVMVNQELTIDPCLPNGWPFPSEEQDGG